MFHPVRLSAVLPLAIAAWLAAATVLAQQVVSETPTAPAETVGKHAAEIGLDEVRDHVGQRVTVEFNVRSSYFLAAKKICFLNSEKNHRDENNFTVIIKGGELLEAFATHDIPQPAEHFWKKRVRVTGEVTLHDERPQIQLADFPSITLVEPPTEGGSTIPPAP